MLIGTTWIDEGLRRELFRLGIKLVRINNNASLVSDYFDMIYYARFTPPLIDYELIKVWRTHKVIYGLHMPLRIDYPIRPTHFVYDIVIPAQVLTASLKGFIIHVLNLDDAHELRFLGVNPIYLPLGTDTSIFKCSSDKPEIFTLIYASRPSWHKGTDLLVNYILPVTLRKLNMDVRIIITDANYDYMQSIYKRIRGIPNVELYPHLPINDYAKLLSESHVLLFPSRYESFGRVVLDALATGALPVTFNVRGFVRDVLLRSTLGEFVVEYGDIATFVSKVIQIYTIWKRNREKYYELVNEACKLANRYSWRNVAPLWANAFKEINSDAQYED